MVTREVNAAIEGAYEGGATEILVNENHTGKEIIPELLDKRALLLSGKPKFMMTAQGIDRYDTLFMLGIHPRAGTADGVMDHTWNPKEICEFRVNNKPIGELGLNALFAAHYGIPVSLVTGDKAVCDEAKDLLGDVETVAVKEGCGRFAAYCPHPEVNIERIKKAAKKAIETHDRFKPLKYEMPMHLEFDFFTQQNTMIAELIPGAERLSPRSIGFTVNNFYEGMKIFCLCGWASCRGTDERY
jgi:D-amino peptidase